MGTKTQEYEASFDMSRAFRKFQRADNAFSNGKANDAVNDLQKGYSLITGALNHIANASEDTYNKAGDKIKSGNDEIQKSIDEYSNGKNDSGARHFSSAMSFYDEALDTIG